MTTHAEYLERARKLLALDDRWPGLEDAVDQLIPYVLDPGGTVAVFESGGRWVAAIMNPMSRHFARAENPVLAATMLHQKLEAFDVSHPDSHGSSPVSATEPN